MNQGTPEQLFCRYREGGAADALGGVFDALAPELLLLGAHLVGGDAAEDLVQATFIDAIRQANRWDAARPLAPWLVGILAMHAARLRRERARQPDPRRLPARPVESPVDAAAAAETAHAVHAAIEALPHGYRQVLSLRVVHGLDLAAIAHSLDLPLGTVKTRLHRGTALLRRALPSGMASALALLAMTERGLAAMRAEVIAAGRIATPVAAATAGGRLLTSMVAGLTMQKIALVGAAALLLLGGWLVTTRLPAGPAAPPDANAATTPTVAAAPSMTAAPSEAAAAPTPAAAALERRVRPSTGTLELAARWQQDEAPAVGVPLLVILHCSSTRHTATTDADGRARLELPPGDYFVMDEGHRAAHIAVAVEAGAKASAQLDFDFDLRLCCTVVDDHGATQPDAEVFTSATGRRGWSTTSLGRTDARGELRYRGLPLPNLFARRAGVQPSPTLPLGRDLRGDQRVHLQLGGPGCALSGIVLDPDDRPLAMAMVAIALDASPENAMAATRKVAVQVHSDADGRFVCTELPAGELLVAATHVDHAASVGTVIVEPQRPAVVTLRVVRGARLEGRAVHRDGLPIAGAEVTIFDPRGGLCLDSAVPIHTHCTTDADGRFAFEQLRPGPVSVGLRAAPELEAHVDLELTSGQTTRWDLALPAGAAILGRVVDRNGAPLSGLAVGLRGNREGGPWNGSDLERTVRTDAAGSFAIDGLAAIPYRLRVFDARATGAAAAVWLAAADDVRPGPDEVLLRVDAPLAERGAIVGSVVWPKDAEPVSVSLFPQDRQLAGFDVPMQELPPGTESFAFGPLPPGDYDLMCDRRGAMRICHRGIRVAAGATIALPELRLDRQHALTIHLQHRDGRPVVDARVLVWWTSVPMECTRSADGAPFVTPLLLPGSYQLSVRGRGFVLTTVRIDVGDDRQQAVTLPIEPAAELTVRVSCPDSPRLLRLLVRDRFGSELASDYVPFDRSAGFVDLPLGLAPGRHVLECQAWPRGARGELVIDAVAPDAAPQQLELVLR